MSYKVIAGFKIYHRKENGWTFKRIALDLGNGLRSARPRFVYHAFMENIADSRQVLGYGKRGSQQKGKNKACKNDETI